MIKRTVCLTSLSVGVMLWPAVGTTADYTYGSWNGPKNVVLTEGVGPYLKAVEKETGGSLKWKLIAGAQLFGGQATLAGIQNRIADAGGPVIPAFTRKALRGANVVYDMINATTSPVVQAGAVAETYLLDCPTCKNDFEKNGTHFIGNYAAPRFNLLCREPIKTAADIKGRKIRVVGALGRFLKDMGAVPVGGSPAKAVQAVQRGNIDCIAGPVSWLKSFGMWDLTKHILDAPFAVQGTPSAMVINDDAWKELSKEQKMALIKHGPSLVANTTVRGYLAEAEFVRKEAEKRGITITKAGQDVLGPLAEHKAKEPKVIAEVAAKEGVKNPEAIVKAHEENVAKWEKIHDKIGDDPDKFAKALWDEVYSKVDPDKL